MAFLRFFLGCLVVVVSTSWAVTGETEGAASESTPSELSAPELEVDASRATDVDFPEIGTEFPEDQEPVVSSVSDTEIPVDTDAAPSPSGIEDLPLTRAEDSSLVQEPPHLVWITVALLSAATFVAVLVSFYLYRWRKVLIKNQDVLLPEELATAINRLSGAFDQLSEANRAFGDESNGNTVKITDGVKTLGRSLLTFQNSLEEKDREISRYKSGYDSEILKRNMVGFVRLALFIDRIEEESDEVRNIRLLLEDALEDCGIEKLIPKIGQRYKSAIGVEDRPRIEGVDDPELDMKIIAVDRHGFRLSQIGESESGVVLKARVAVGRYVEEQE